MRTPPRLREALLGTGLGLLDCAWIAGDPVLLLRVRPLELALSTGGILGVLISSRWLYGQRFGPASRWARVLWDIGLIIYGLLFLVSGLRLLGWI